MSWKDELDLRKNLRRLLLIAPLPVIHCTLWVLSSPTCDCYDATVQAANTTTTRAVALELVLTIDASASVDDREFDLQVEGVVQAFQDPTVVDAIRALGSSGLAVTLMQWSSSGQQAQMVPWRVIHDGEGADRFAQDIAKSRKRRFARGTAIGSAILFARHLMISNGFIGQRMAIDVAGDGMNNNGLDVTEARDFAVAEGITVNGLAVLGQDTRLAEYYGSSVIGGANAFVIDVANYDHIIAATRRKLLREIQPNLSRHDRPTQSMHASYGLN